LKKASFFPNQARAEQLMLKTYNIDLPKSVSMSSSASTVDDISLIDNHDDDSASATAAVACVGNDDEDDDASAIADISDNGTVDYDEDEADDYDDDAVACDKDGHFVSTAPDILPGGKSLPLGYIFRNQKDVLEGPSNRRQIYNIKARTQSKGQVIPKANFADQVSALEEPQHTMRFMKLIVRHYKKVPFVILYTEEQISDIKRFCCPPVTVESTVLGFDKTFSLSNVDVTVSAYKCLAVKRRSTNDHLIFCGLLLLPQAPRLTCTRHLRQNFSHTLADKVGLPKQERQRFITKIFGDNGIIAHGTDHMDIASTLQHMAESTGNRFVQKLIELMSPLLVENAKGLERPGLHFASPLWTNNNCESLNHCLKQALSWRSLKLVELVQKLHSIIKTQHREVQQAICGVGEFVLLMNTRGLVNPKMCGIPTLENNKNDT
ncbi:hypothetical protein PoB_000531200, partial [Plakobranchus ocellatus]